jgi:hypothetical protein
MRCMVLVEFTLTKSLWSENGWWFSSGNESRAYRPRCLVVAQEYGARPDEDCRLGHTS